MRDETPLTSLPSSSIVVALLLLLSVLTVSVGSASGLTVDPLPESGGEDPLESALDTSHWDWEFYADDHGNVDVVVVATEDNTSGDLLSSRAEILSGVPEILESAGKSGSAGVGTIEREYSHAFTGVATRLNIESILKLESLSTSIQVYPDFEMSSMVGENIQQVGADHVWTLDDPSGNPVMGSGVVVAVVDTGVDYTHPDLGGGFGPGYKVIGGYDYVNNDADPMDDHGHGTHVAGIVAASGMMQGVAPEASILAFKVLDQSGSGSMSDVIAGIEAAMDPNNDGDLSDHADVISLSLGGPGESGDPLCIAVRSAVEAGIVVVVAAGNDGPRMGTVASPGLEPKAITVGAIDGNGVLASFSSRGTSSESLLKPEISAPGVSITSTVPYSGASYSSPTGYRSMSGTSMATPHVSGVAALLLQLHPDWSPKQVKSAIITGSEVLGEPLWHAGAGGLWAPLAAEADLFLTDPRLSCLTPDGTSKSISITNGGTAVTYTLDTDDWHSASYNGSSSERYWTNASSVSPSSLALSAGGNGIANVAVVAPEAPSPEGYYDGVLYLTGSAHTVRIPFGFVVLSHLNVHVLNKLGKEVSDPRGVVFVYSYPDASISLLSESTPSSPSPPASFRLPSGTYSVHALGHQLFYSFSDPYVLSGSASLGRMSTVDVYLSMVDAREFVLNLTTADGNPIYAKDFVLYCRYVGSKNVSALAVSSDSSIIGSELFSLTKSRHVYISDTDATVGISIAGFSYSADMWDFISMNWQHWYEFSGSSSTEFLIESTADLQYLISWELNGVDSTRPLTLGVDEARSSVFNTKYDILGTFDRIWGSGNHLSIGGDATPYARRDTYTSLNPFFSGMTRTTIVQGVYFEKYWPGSLSDVYVSPQYYVPDYSHRVKASDVPDVYLADRICLDPIEGIEESVRVGAGPFYPSVQTMNTGSSFVLLHPLLRDSGGARVATPETPWLYLYRDGSVVYSSKLDEYRGSPSPMRVVPISGGKSYQAIIPTWSLASRVSDTALITLSFSMNTTDINPPAVTSLAMPQRFIPGGSVTLELSTVDDVAVAGVTALWRSSGSSAWKTLTVQDLGAGKFRASIHTATTDAGIDLKFRVTDTTGNYLEYTTTHASLKQVPILFDLSIEPGDVSYVDGDVSVVVSGRLTDSNGSPLCPTNAVPIDLMLGDRKVGMLLDEHVEGSTHYHDGTIRYEWHFNPARLFTGPDQTIEITARADLGIYQPRSATILLHSVKTGNSLPTIRLVSPTNGSLIPAGETIDLSVWDDGVCTANAYLDGNLLGQLSPPWDVDTSVWAEGGHTLSIVATDDEGAVSTASYSFEVDAFAPSVEIIYPTNGSNVPVNSIVNAEVYDSHLSSVSYSVDGLPGVALNAPYDIDTSSWSIGAHIVIIQAADQVGNVASRSVSFVIVRGSVAIGIASPLDWNVLHSGVPIVLSIVGNGVVTARWSDSGVWHDLGSDFTISTEGWSEGAHMIVINASNDLGEYDELRPVITIDDTPPSILLEFPGNNSFVDRSDEIRLAVHDANLKSVTYTVWNHTVSRVLGSVVVPLTLSPGDGYFEIDVSSLDSAGNQRSAMFSFVMDSEAPSISIEGLTSGCALKPGFPLNITAFDMFLETVMFSLDAGGQVSLTPPYGVDTSSFSNGWHLLQVVASDLSGKESLLNMSFYVDALSPAVKLSEVSSYTPNASLEVRASVSDDYGVAIVQLFYELQGGGYRSVVMAGYDGVYVAELAPNLLWRGMTIYVLATDKVGNVAESPRMTLQPATSPFDGNLLLPGNPSGWGAATWAWIVSTNGLAVPALIGMIALAGFVLYARRRREDESTERTVKPKPSPKGVSNASPFAELPPPKPIMAASAKQIVASVKAAAKTVGQVQVPTRVPTAVASGSGAPARAMLLDSIPEITLNPDVKSPEDDIDYGELIERELNTSAWKNSAFGKGIGDSAVSREFDARPDRPGIVSGLKLMKIME